jgi:hypothetical protein
MSPGQATIIRAIYPGLIRREIGTLRCCWTGAEASCRMGQRRDCALLPRLARIGAAQGTHPVVHADVECALIMTCALHSAYL